MAVLISEVTLSLQSGAVSTAVSFRESPFRVSFVHAKGAKRLSKSQLRIHGIQIVVLLYGNFFLTVKPSKFAFYQSFPVLHKIIELSVSNAEFDAVEGHGFSRL